MIGVLWPVRRVFWSTIVLAAFCAYFGYGVSVLSGYFCRLGVFFCASRILIRSGCVRWVCYFFWGGLLSFGRSSGGFVVASGRLAVLFLVVWGASCGVFWFSRGVLPLGVGFAGSFPPLGVCVFLLLLCWSVVFSFLCWLSGCLVLSWLRLCGVLFRFWVALSYW